MGTRIKASLAVLFALYLAFLLYLTLFGRTTSYATVAECFRERGNLIPLHTLIRQTSALINGHYSARLYVMNVAGNIAAFAPFGFFLPALFPKCRRFLPFFLILSLSIVAVEVCQLILRVGSLDVDDYILRLREGSTFVASDDVRLVVGSFALSNCKEAGKSAKQGK